MILGAPTVQRPAAQDAVPVPRPAAPLAPRRPGAIAPVLQPRWSPRQMCLDLQPRAGADGR